MASISARHAFLEITQFRNALDGTIFDQQREQRQQRDVVGQEKALGEAHGDDGNADLLTVDGHRLHRAAFGEVQEMDVRGRIRVREAADGARGERAHAHVGGIERRAENRDI